VSEGIALGLVMCDRDSLPFNKVTIDLSFTAELAVPTTVPSS
jgi:hypothetical protein